MFIALILLKVIFDVVETCCFFAFQKRFALDREIYFVYYEVANLAFHQPFGVGVD